MGFEHALTVWDRTAFLAINRGMQCPALDRIMPPISDLGLGHIQILGILILAVLIGVLKREVRHPVDIWSAIVARRRWVVPLLVAFAISGLGATACKSRVPRDRPWWFYKQEHEAGQLLGVHVHTIPGRRPIRVRGFVSGHMATSVALAMAVTLLYWRRPRTAWRIAAAWALAMLIGMSRIYIADHWPLDVVCGTILGIVSGWAAVHICRRWRPVGLSETAGEALHDGSSGPVVAAKTDDSARRRRLLAIPANRKARCHAAS